MTHPVKKPPIDLVPTILEGGGLLLYLPAAQAGWQNISNLSQREVVTNEMGHPVESAESAQQRRHAKCPPEMCRSCLSDTLRCGACISFPLSHKQKQLTCSRVNKRHHGKLGIVPLLANMHTNGHTTMSKNFSIEHCRLSNMKHTACI